MIVLGLDPSLTNTGIAILEDGQPLYLTSTGLAGHNADTYRDRSRRIRALCQRILQHLAGPLELGIDLAVIEGPAFSRHTGASFDRSGLWHGLYASLDARNVPTAVVTPTTRSKWATGHGRADKTAVLAAVRAWWPQLAIANHDQADALVLAAIGAHHHGDPMPFQVKPRHTAGLDAVHWPELSDR